jgi:hypothetical protein
MLIKVDSDTILILKLKKIPDKEDREAKRPEYGSRLLIQPLCHVLPPIRLVT